MRYIVPALANSLKVILAVNVGGAVIPTLPGTSGGGGARHCETGCATYRWLPRP